MHKARELSYKASHMYHAMVGLILDLTLHTEDSDWFGDTVKIFLFPVISLLDIIEVALVVMRCYMTLDSSMMTIYDDTASLIQR